MSHLIVSSFVERHVGEAGFYWQQRNRCATAVLVKFPKLHDFDLLLQLHLDGITAASDAGWDLAWEALERWQGQGEVFVCTILAVHHGVHAERLHQILEQVAQQPEHLLRGLISALLWCDSTPVAPLIDSWTTADAPIIQQVAAWCVIVRSPALAVNTDSARRLYTALQQPEPHLRAAACRAAVRFGQTEALTTCLTDEHPAVAAEAAIALRRASTLWQSVSQSLQTLPTGGLAKVQAERRLQRWLQHLALLVPIGNADVPRLLDTLSPRLALHFVLHHADPAYLPWVVQRMEDATCARLAGWVWQAITGIDLEQHELTRDEPVDSPDDDTDDLDPGLPLPDAQKISAYPLTLPAAPVLLGQPLTQIQLLVLLNDAPQPLRWNAAQRMAATAGREILNTQARANLQRMALERLTIETTA